MGMSYRGAWGYVQELEQAAGFAFLERDASGARLTAQGREFLAAFERFRDRVESAATQSFDDFDRARR